MKSEAMNPAMKTLNYISKVMSRPHSLMISQLKHFFRDESEENRENSFLTSRIEWIGYWLNEKLLDEILLNF